MPLFGGGLRHMHIRALHGAGAGLSRSKLPGWALILRI